MSTFTQREKSHQINIILNDQQIRNNQSVQQATYINNKEIFQVIDNHFNKFIGLQHLKKYIKEIYAMRLINERRQQIGLNCAKQVLHMMFKGNPGTGKTTFARTLAQLYYELNILSKGHIIEVDRADLVGEYIGQTAQKTRRMIKRAIGGILFIDEAYSLARGGEKDFGREAIDSLVKQMEDYQNDLVIIMAGYPAEMNYFLRLNPGLESRFPFIVDFPDYCVDELIKIAKQMAQERDYLISKQTLRLLTQHFNYLLSDEGYNFSNARYIRNIVERAIRKQAMRLINTEPILTEDLMLLTNDDFYFIEKV